jgi:hypothetical protein
MPAPSLDVLLNFEENFEEVGQAVLTTAGVTSFISQQQQQLFSGRSIYTGIGLDLGSALDELAQIPKPGDWPANTPPPVEFFRYDATLVFRVAVQRDANASPDPNVGTLFAFVRSRIRNSMMLCTAPFNSTNLPYYSVSSIRPAGSTWGYETQRNVDFQELRWALRFAINNDAWPAWPSAPAFNSGFSNGFS